jgi:hypothetical protein
MADIKISQLTAKGTAIASTDLVEISQSDGAGGYVTKSVTGANIIGSKQDTLISGTNIKTVNSTTLLGSGNLVIGGVTAVSATTPIVATGTTTPVISLAASYGDTQNPYASKTANNILAAPNGTSGVPTFRAIVGADIPTLNQNTTGTAANVTGIVALANGGTGTTTPSLVAGTNITITGSFPNQTIAASGAAGAVTQIVAGTNVTISPAGGTGIVTINSSGGGGGGTEIGALIGGGIVVGVFVEGGVNKALVASLTNLSTTLPYTITAYQAIAIGATARSYYDGLTNTNAIIAQTLLPANTTYAAGIARLFAGGGYSDWYLPALWELNMLYNSSTVVNRVLGATNGMLNLIYWSSTEAAANSASVLIMSDSSQYNNSKAGNLSVRAVRIHTI